MLKTPTTPPAPTSEAPPPQNAPPQNAMPSRSSSADRAERFNEPAQHSSAQNRADRARRRFWIKAIAVVVVVGGLIAAAGAVATRTMPESYDGATLAHTITRGDLFVTVIEQGTLESSNNVEVRSKVWGWKTVNWVIESGTVVEKGELLVELDASEMEKKVDDANINFHNARANMITAESNVTVSDKSIDEYVRGTFVEERTSILLEIFDAEQAVTKAELGYASILRMAGKGLVEKIQVDGELFKLESARQKLSLKKTRLQALEEFKYTKQKEKLESDLRAAEARLDAAKATVDLAQTNVTQHEEQLSYHTIIAPQDGMVIHPQAAAHRAGPDVEEGANVHTNQVLLIMPDLDQMQVKLGIHESMIDRVQPGLVARVTIGNLVIDGEVSEVATVTKPATWYTGNVVKFDTIVAIDGQSGLKPGLSAEVEVIIAEHTDVLTIPVAAVVEKGEEHFCWIRTAAGGAQRRQLSLGDSNDLFIVVESGLKEGDEVVLNPLAFIDEAQDEVLKPLDESSKTKESPKTKESNETTGSTEKAGSRAPRQPAGVETTPPAIESP
jgi:HlyD family secretion protein